MRTLQCPECGESVRILETRKLQNGDKRRRVQCRGGHRHTFYGLGDSLPTVSMLPAQSPVVGGTPPVWSALHGALFKEK